MIVVLAGLKGGVGKTTVALALASACVAAGRRILLVDLDPGATLTLWAQTAIAQGERPPPTLTAGAVGDDPQQLRRLADGYHAVIVDCPAQDAGRTAVAMAGADRVLLPCSPNPADIWGLARVFEVAGRVRQDRPDLRVDVVLNRVDARRNEHLHLRQTLDELGTPALDPALHARAVHADAMAAGSWVHALEPRGQAATEATALLETLAASGPRPGLVPAALH